jgi:hypothetical protein
MVCPLWAWGINPAMGIGQRTPFLNTNRGYGRASLAWISRGMTVALGCGMLGPNSLNFLVITYKSTVARRTDNFTTENTEDTEFLSFSVFLRALRGEMWVITS